MDWVSHNGRIGRASSPSWPTHAPLLEIRRQIYARLADNHGRQAQVDKLLAQAQAQWSNEQPGTPQVDAAIGKYRAVIELDPRNIEALRALNGIRDSYLAGAKVREQARDLDGAQHLLDSALVHFSSQPDLRAARDRLVALRATERANKERVAVMLAAAGTRTTKIGASILDFQTEVRVLERGAQRELETGAI